MTINWLIFKNENCSALRRSTKYHTYSKLYFIRPPSNGRALLALSSAQRLQRHLHDRRSWSYGMWCTMTLNWGGIDVISRKTVSSYWVKIWPPPPPATPWIRPWRASSKGIGHFLIYHDTLFFPSKILQKHCFQFFQSPKRNWKQCFCKILERKRALW